MTDQAPMQTVNRLPMFRPGFSGTTELAPAPPSLTERVISSMRTANPLGAVAGRAYEELQLSRDMAGVTPDPDYRAEDDPRIQQAPHLWAMVADSESAQETTLRLQQADRIQQLRERNDDAAGVMFDMLASLMSPSSFVGRLGVVGRMGAVPRIGAEVGVEVAEELAIYASTPGMQPQEAMLGLAAAGLRGTLEATVSRRALSHRVPIDAADDINADVRSSPYRGTEEAPTRYERIRDSLREYGIEIERDNATMSAVGGSRRAGRNRGDGAGGPSPDDARRAGGASAEGADVWRRIEDGDLSKPGSLNPDRFDYTLEGRKRYRESLREEGAAAKAEVDRAREAASEAKRKVDEDPTQENMYAFARASGKLRAAEAEVENLRESWRNVTDDIKEMEADPEAFLDGKLPEELEFPCADDQVSGQAGRSLRSHVGRQGNVWRDGRSAPSVHGQLSCQARRQDDSLGVQSRSDHGHEPWRLKRCPRDCRSGWHPSQRGL